MGDKLSWEGWNFEVIEMDRRRIDKVLVTKQQAVQPDEKSA